MPAGRTTRYNRRKRRKPYKKKTAYKKKRPYRRQLGLRTMNPVTRRRLVDTVKHVYDNNAILQLPSWSAFYSTGTGTYRNLNQIFSGNSINIFQQGGFNGANTGNYETASPFTSAYMKYAKEVSSTFENGADATVMPGYSGQTPYMSNMYNHYQVLGTRLEVSIRVIPPLSATHSIDDYIPIKVFVVPISERTSGNTSKTTEQIEQMPFVRKRILHNLNTNRNARIVINHSPKKFNGIQKGQFVGDSRYLASTNLPTSGTANTPQELDSIALMFAPLNRLMAETLPVSKIPPRLHISIKKTQWVRYTDPTITNYNAVGQQA